MPWYDIEVAQFKKIFEMNVFSMWRLWEHTPIHRLGGAEDIAGAVLYFAALISIWTSGQVIFVNGGGEQTLDM